MNLNKKNCGGYHCIPDVVLKQIFADMDSLGMMLRELIGLYEKESKLKKHHRAYLHVREYADQACAGYKKKVIDIAGRWTDNRFTCEDMGCDRPTDDSCVNEVQETQEKTSEEVDFSSLPKGMVMMTSESLGVMHDDVICLTEGLDTMAALFKAIMAGCPMSKADVEAVLNMTSAMSDEILERWEKAEMIELN